MKLSKNAKDVLNIFTQKKFSPRNESMDILFQKQKIKLREQNIILIFQDKVDPLLTLQK